MVKIAKGILYLWHLLTKYSSFQKYHFTKMAPNINSTSLKWQLPKAVSHKNWISKHTLLVSRSTINTLLIEPTPTIRDKFPFKSHSAQLLANKLWTFFHKAYHLCKAPFFLGEKFVYFSWSICHVPFL